VGHNWSSDVYALTMSEFGREIWINPLISQPGQPSYQARGIYNHNLMNLALDDGSTFVEQETILDILAADFPVLPQQNDEVTIPADPFGMQDAPGDFIIASAWDNGGGEFSLHLKKKI
jgi:hypothetical protein